MTIYQYNRELSFLRQLIIDGQWDDAEEFLKPLKDQPNFEYNSSIFEIRKQKFMEAVENVEDWNLFFATETQLHIVTDDCTLTTKAPVEEGLDTDVLWNIEAKWFSKTKPVITPLAPIVTLLKCFEIA